MRLWVEIDGNNVPVATDDLLAGPGEDDAADDDDEVGEVGEVTFCNRAYQRTVSDGENDGLDSEHDYIRTRTANAFNWLALDTGFNYDNPANGNNVLHVVLWADFDETSAAGESVADAYVGSRTMIIEPVKVSVHEEVAPHEPTPAPTVTARRP